MCMFGILATIIAAVKGHSGFAWFTGIWTAIALIVALSGMPQYSFAPGMLFFVIALIAVVVAVAVVASVSSVETRDGEGEKE